MAVRNNNHERLIQIECYIKTYRTEINKNLKINPTHEQLLTEIASQFLKQN